MADFLIAHPWIVVALTALGFLIGYLLSLKWHPYRNCRVCAGGRRRGTIFTKGLRTCGRCAGRGRRLRAGTWIALNITKVEPSRLRLDAVDHRPDGPARQPWWRMRK